MRTPCSLIVTALLALGCSAGPPTQAPIPSGLPAAPVAEATPVVAPVPEMEVTSQGLRMSFAPAVERTEALRFAWNCWFDEGENPRVGGLRCPMQIGRLHIDVAEGPGGVMLMLRIGDAQSAHQLRDWYRVER